MSSTDESGTVQVRRFAPESEADSYTVVLVIAAASLLFSLILTQIELYSFYKYILFFKTGG